MLNISLVLLLLILIASLIWAKTRQTRLKRLQPGQSRADYDAKNVYDTLDYYNNYDAYNYNGTEGYGGKQFAYLEVDDVPARPIEEEYVEISECQTGDIDFENEVENGDDNDVVPETIPNRKPIFTTQESVMSHSYVSIKKPLRKKQSQKKIEVLKSQKEIEVLETEVST